MINIAIIINAILSIGLMGFTFFVVILSPFYALLSYYRPGGNMLSEYILGSHDVYLIIGFTIWHMVLFLIHFLLLLQIAFSGRGIRYSIGLAIFEGLSFLYMCFALFSLFSLIFEL